VCGCEPNCSTFELRYHVHRGSCEAAVIAEDDAATGLSERTSERVRRERRGRAIGHLGAGGNAALAPLLLPLGVARMDEGGGKYASYVSGLVVRPQRRSAVLL